MENVLVITGRKGSGKDTLCEEILRNFMLEMTDLSDVFESIEICSFSDELRELAHELFPWCPLNPTYQEKEQPIDHPANALGLSPRGVWKHLAGEDVTSLRRVDPNILVNRFKKRWYQKFKDQPQTLFIIKDWRTLQEEAFIENQDPRWPRVRILDGRPEDQRSFDSFENPTDTFDVDLVVTNEHNVLSIQNAAKEVIHLMLHSWVSADI